MTADAAIQHGGDADQPAIEVTGSPVAAIPVDSDDPFWVDIPAFQGPLQALLSRAQHGEIDLPDVSVHEITLRYRERLATAEPRPSPTEVADFLAIAARLLQLKAEQLLPDGPPASADPDENDRDPNSEPGRRLAEYRLFKAAAEALLVDATEEGARSFLGIVASDVVPVERLRIAPERLAAAFRAVLERLAAVEPIPVGTVTFSVEDKAAALRAVLAGQRTLDFEALFADVATRLEAVAIFLGLLELLRNGEAQVQQVEAFAKITVSRVD